jgi:uncharacterized protein (TIGR03083 family)
MADAHIEALRASVARLHSLVADMPTDQLTRPAYPTKWTIADVLSHLGSGATITARRLDDTIAGSKTPDDFAPAVWDAWNAKTPEAQRGDALSADAELLERIDAATADERARFVSSMGPMTLDFEQFVGLRLNEHALHTWDIEVVDDPAATLPEQAASLIVENLGLIARFTAKPTGEARTITITTTEPDRSFAVELSADAVQFRPTPSEPSADVTLPAEAFARLVYGRLDPEHTPVGAESEATNTLRKVFPGP